MSNLGEDAESFFRRGDEGTYEGGPASVIPFALCDEPAEEPTVGATEEQLERRRRLKRIVATIIGALSTGLLFLFAWLLGASARGTEIEGSRAHPDPPPRATHVAAAPATPSDVSPSPPVATTALTEATTLGRPTDATPVVSREQNAIAPRRSRSFEGRIRRTTVDVRKQSVARARASFGSTSPGVHGPPTANFPD